MTEVFLCKWMMYSVNLFILERDSIIVSVLFSAESCLLLLAARQVGRPGSDTKLFSVVLLWKSEWRGPEASLISAWRRRAGDESVSFGFTSAIASDRWSETERIREIFSLPHAYQSSVLRSGKNGIPSQPAHPTTPLPPPKVFCLRWWASEEFSIEADGVKARAASNIPMRETLPSF